jgi:hypothetical protein
MRRKRRLLRYCARPPFALAHLHLIDDQRVTYRLPKAQRDGTMAAPLTALELIDHLAALIPPLTLHRSADGCNPSPAPATRRVGC